MARQYSDVERSNLSWFKNDFTVASLRKIQVRKGEVRGLKKVSIDFDYPITAIAGKNGCGKSTVIALAACAFHNARDGWKLPNRVSTYYTFSDFFVQAGGEKPLDDIAVWFSIQHDAWQASARLPDGRGQGWQLSQKRKGGRWSDYEQRVDRPVAFLGVERVVPSVEKSVFRSYRRHFSAGGRSGFEEAVCTAVSRVLGVRYDSFEFREHGKYRLPWAQKRRGAGYSGFNMGAGEKALFEFFATILSAPKGALFLVDEIELGLHEQAQSMLVRVLSELCQDRHIQVICTTHSPVILGCLPPEGRLFIDSRSSVPMVIPGISPEYATGRMSGKNSSEITVYVEDAKAADLLHAFLPGEMRSRVRVCSIGSCVAVMNSMAARFKDKSLGKAIAVLDGDQRAAKNAHLRRFIGLTEQAASKDWMSERLQFLPGQTSPEVCVLSKIREADSEVLRDYFRFDPSTVLDAIDAALLAGTHSELTSFAASIHQDVEQTWKDCCRLFVAENPDALSEPLAVVQKFLDGA